MLINKRGSVPIVIVVVLTLIIFTFTLVAFFMSHRDIFQALGKEVAFVEDFHAKAEAREFAGLDVSNFELSQAREKKFLWFFSSGDGEELIKVRVIP
jgi:ABC-type uncharacterized transport system permease subunit